MSYNIGVDHNRTRYYSIVGGVVRVTEFVTSIVVLSLTAYMEDGIEMNDQYLLRLALASSAISTAYLIAVFAGTLTGGRLTIAAPLLFLEFALFSLWLSSFVCLALAFNDCDRWPSQESVQGFYYIEAFVSRCRAAKTSITFSAVATLSFLISLVMMLVNLVLPITSCHGLRFLWMPVSSMGATVERGTALRLLKEPAFEIYETSQFRFEKPVADPALYPPRF